MQRAPCFPERCCADADQNYSTTHFVIVLMKAAVQMFSNWAGFQQAMVKGLAQFNGSIWKAVSSFFLLEKTIGITVVQSPHIGYVDVFMYLVLPLTVKYQTYEILSEMQKAELIIAILFSLINIIYWKILNFLDFSFLSATLNQLSNVAL